MSQNQRSKKKTLVEPQKAIDNMTKEIETLIRKSFARDVEIEMLKKEEEGLIISKEVVLEILKDLENR